MIQISRRRLIAAGASAAALAGLPSRLAAAAASQGTAAGMMTELRYEV